MNLNNVHQDKNRFRYWENEFGVLKAIRREEMTVMNSKFKEIELSESGSSKKASGDEDTDDDNREEKDEFVHKSRSKSKLRTLGRLLVFVTKIGRHAISRRIKPRDR